MSQIHPPTVISSETLIFWTLCNIFLYLSWDVHDNSGEYMCQPSHYNGQCWSSISYSTYKEHELLSDLCLPWSTLCPCRLSLAVPQPDWNRTPGRFQYCHSRKPEKEVNQCKATHLLTYIPSHCKLADINTILNLNNYVMEKNSGIGRSGEETLLLPFTPAGLNIFYRKKIRTNSSNIKCYNLQGFYHKVVTPAGVKNKDAGE